MRSHIRHYRIIKEIGRGAMGRVYLAYDEVIQRHVAIKELILPEGIDEEERREAVERFKREAQAAGRLSHPNIITIHGVEEEDGVPFIVMEYLEGTTLGQALNSGPLGTEQAVSIASQILNALHYAHQRDVVHRDIKPDNVFILYDGRVKVADFGIARVTGSSTMTQVGTVMGSPGYMSPEQVRGERTDARTDIFACGVILYEMLAGLNPFASGDLTSVMYKVVHEDPPPLPSAPPYLQAIVSKAIAKDKEARYQDAEQMNRDLLAGRPPEVTSPGTVVLPTSASETVHLAPEPAQPSGTVIRPGGSAAPALTTVPARARRFKAPVLAALVAALVLVLGGGAILAVLLLSSSQVTVPDLVGVDASDAASLLEKAGLSMDEEEVSYSGYADGEVVSQVPAAGQKVEKGSRVKVEVNRGGASASRDGQRPEGYTKTMDVMISELVGLDSQIRNLAVEINNNIDPAGHRMKKDMRPQCDGLMASLNGLKSKALALSAPPEFNEVHQQFVQLVGYCVERVNAFYAGMSAVESGGDYESAFNLGIAPKDAYTALFPEFQSRYSLIKGQQR